MTSRCSMEAPSSRFLARVFLCFFLSFNYYYDVTKETIYYKKGVTAKEKS
ncbi:hypothetical protein DFP95_109150 [Cohnella lupini]|uniref:Uncharacterized protein n=1 Tax=Cohnella lupini TaxID=1294267 RepID=A0A3D9I8M6_9BACL|nr:hypothetical protein DFP95_109150 [Cohnella lupini]